MTDKPVGPRHRPVYLLPDPTIGSLPSDPSEPPAAGHARTSGPFLDGAGSDLAGSDMAGSDLADNDMAGSDLAGSDLAGRDMAGRDIGGSDDAVLSAADEESTERTDWPWVQEWRAGQEPTPWATGLGLAGFSALVVGVAIWVLAAGLVDRPVVAVAVNLLVAGGLAPAIWLSRELPVLRWIAVGALVGIIGGWIAALLMLPLPAP
jgi:Protein of unknown function (DUF2537)